MSSAFYSRCFNQKYFRFFTFKYLHLYNEILGMLGHKRKHSSGFIDTYANNLTLSLNNIFTLHFDSNLFSEVRSGVLVFLLMTSWCVHVCVCTYVYVCVGGRYMWMCVCLTKWFRDWHHKSSPIALNLIFENFNRMCSLTVSCIAFFPAFFPPSLLPFFFFPPFFFLKPIESIQDY